MVLNKERIKSLARQLAASAVSSITMLYFGTRQQQDRWQEVISSISYNIISSHPRYTHTHTHTHTSRWQHMLIAAYVLSVYPSMQFGSLK